MSSSQNGLDSFAKLNSQSAWLPQWFESSFLTISSLRRKKFFSTQAHWRGMLHLDSVALRRNFISTQVHQEVTPSRLGYTEEELITRLTGRRRLLLTQLSAVRRIFTWQGWDDKPLCLCRTVFSHQILQSKQYAMSSSGGSLFLKYLVRSLFSLLLLPLIVSTSIEPYTSELARLNNSDLLLVEVLTETLNCFLDKQSLWGFFAMSRQMDEQLLASVYNPSSLYTHVSESLLPQILLCLFLN